MMSDDRIRSGVCFDTPFEMGCIAIDDPDEHGNFSAVDSDGHVCLFNIQMLTSLRERTKDE